MMLIGVVGHSAINLGSKVGLKFDCVSNGNSVAKAWRTLGLLAGMALERSAAPFETTVVGGHV